MIECELNLSITTQRLTESLSSGRISKSWANSLTSQATRKRQLNGDEIRTNSRVGFTAEDVWYFNGAPSIIEGDRIVYNSQYYYVGRVYNPHELGEFIQVYTGTIKDQV